MLAKPKAAEVILRKTGRDTNVAAVLKRNEASIEEQIGVLGGASPLSNRASTSKWLCQYGAAAAQQLPEAGQPISRQEERPPALVLPDMRTFVGADDCQLLRR